MDYSELAEELFENMIAANKSSSFSKLLKTIHGEMLALHLIDIHDGDITPSEISKIANTSTARITAELNSLEKKGFIAREIDSNNRRRVLVRLTPDGEKVTREHHQHVLEETEELLSKLGERDAKVYIRIIGKIGRPAMKSQA